MDTTRDGRDGSINLGGPVHYVDFGGNVNGPTFVLVHGLGGSHLNWELLAPLLTPAGRVVALDLPGFGLSEPGERPATVPANVRVLDRFLRQVADGPAVLVGNSMGGMIAILLAASHPERVSGLVLLDPALPTPMTRLRNPAADMMFVAYALPGIGERIMRARHARLGHRPLVESTLKMCGVDLDTLPPDLVERSVALIEERSDVAAMERAFLSAARSLLWAVTWARPYRQAMSAVTAPVLLLHGDKDRLVPVVAARDAARRHPEWRYEELAGVGHVPQLQVPDRLASLILDWLPALAAS